MKIRENMPWPPSDSLRLKMAEHSAWYSGDADIISSYYQVNGALSPFAASAGATKNSFWRRIRKSNEGLALHVPIAGDIAETSADLLMGEKPLIKISEAHEETASSSAKKTQDLVDLMLNESKFFTKTLEGAESSAAIGGVFLKVAWDENLSEYPLLVVEQADTAYPEFKFGILTKVTFCKYLEEESSDSVVYRLMETYLNNGTIRYELYKGRSDNLGSIIDINELESTKGLQDVDTGIKDILCVYVPNMLPNRYLRNSYLGRSDYAGIEGLMDSLDETYSSWIKEIALAQSRILIPESYLEKLNNKDTFNIDKSLYVKLDMDPLTDGQKIIVNQFDIRADQFEKSCRNFLARIVSSAGYSQQTFGLIGESQRESGFALSIRERKSMATKTKKESYWGPALKRLVKIMMLIYNKKFNAKIDIDTTPTINFSDSVTNDLSEVSSSLQKLEAAVAVSIKTKVQMLHPDWTVDQIQSEVDMILKEQGINEVDNPEKIIIDNEE